MGGGCHSVRHPIDSDDYEGFPKASGSPMSRVSNQAPSAGASPSDVGLFRRALGLAIFLRAWLVGRGALGEGLELAEQAARRANWPSR